MKLAVIGGRLQGVEACYLARKAGIETLLVDREEARPARGLCDGFIKGDVCAPSKTLIDALRSADMVLPANENARALEAIDKLTREHSLSTAFDFAAYAVSSSKILSDELFHKNSIPAPGYWPDCKAPYILKPSGESGSAGVVRFDSAPALEAYMASLPKDAKFVAQEYVSGPSYSIEVIGRPGAYKTYQVTEIHTDEIYDCCRVTCPCGLDAALNAQMEHIAEKMATLLGLCGIMDVETILHAGIMKTLEIDARLPSQTPTAVYRSTGVNFIEELFSVFTEYKPPARDKRAEYVSFEHIVCDKWGISFPGEHIMAERPPLTLHEGLFGADEALTDWKRGDDKLTGTFINSAPSARALERKRRAMLDELTAYFKI